jgi:hypothetical protein
MSCELDSNCLNGILVSWATQAQLTATIAKPSKVKRTFLILSSTSSTSMLLVESSAGREFLFSVSIVPQTWYLLRFCAAVV